MDDDRDGWLTDSNIIDMQESIFGLNLSKIHLASIKDIIKQEL